MVDYRDTPLVLTADEAKIISLAGSSLDALDLGAIEAPGLYSESAPASLCDLSSNLRRLPGIHPGWASLAVSRYSDLSVARLDRNTEFLLHFRVHAPDGSYLGVQGSVLQIHYSGEVQMTPDVWEAMEMLHSILTAKDAEVRGWSEALSGGIPTCITPCSPRLRKILGPHMRYLHAPGDV